VETSAIEIEMLGCERKSFGKYRVYVFNFLERGRENWRPNAHPACCNFNLLSRTHNRP